MRYKTLSTYTSTPSRDSASNSDSQTKTQVTPYVDVTTAENNNKKKRFLYHYTSQSVYVSIWESGVIWPSLKALRPSDARGGDGVYFTDIPPDTMSPEPLAKILYNRESEAYKTTDYFVVDVTDLKIKTVRPHFFVYNTNVPLPLTGRFISSGHNFGPGGPADGYDFLAS
ncbi:HYD1 signature containing ADP-ribosyltransferase family protein [Paenibacillus planticolens]|uniref:Tox-ART-HYD1 domain-containing protein n=1 Tax=Paenibacillus planticolens TaxID=2654976 RepID=A0ABX1ZMV9_9BACL|nr:HYD1 signature containing ADP-ribosyltransferase family protein [Paenibacillus planticolens]NOV01397.1 hypothetical protein [Paenibacillus planticolens]